MRNESFEEFAEELVSGLLAEGWSRVEPGKVIETSDGADRLQFVFVPYQEAEVFIKAGVKNSLYDFSHLHLAPKAPEFYVVTFILPAFKVEAKGKVTALYREIKRTDDTNMKRLKKSFEGYVEYDNDANDFFYEWVMVGDKEFIDMLREMGWDWKPFGKKAKVRVTIEVLDPGDQFSLDEGMRRTES